MPLERAIDSGSRRLPLFWGGRTDRANQARRSTRRLSIPRGAAADPPGAPREARATRSCPGCGAGAADACLGRAACGREERAQAQRRSALEAASLGAKPATCTPAAARSACQHRRRHDLWYGIPGAGTAEGSIRGIPGRQSWRSDSKDSQDGAEYRWRLPQGCAQDHLARHK